MPLRKRTYSRRRPRRTTKRSYTKKRKYVTPVSKQLGLGTSHIAKLKYCEEITINPATAGIAVNVFRANDLFDPNLTGTGHQPYGFDNLCPGLYDHFTVIGSKIKVQIHQNATNSVVPAWCGILLSDNGTTAAASSNVEHLLESYGCGSVLPAGLVGAPNGAMVETKLFKNFSAKKYFKKSSIVGAADYRGDSATSPNESAYFEVFAASMNSNDPGAIDMLVTIEYIAVFTEPKRVAQS